MSQYDLSPRMIPYLDRHLIYPLLEFLSFKHVYPENDLLNAKFRLISKTNMIDLTGDLYKRLYDTSELPEEFSSKRTKVLENLSDFMSKTRQVLDVLEKPEVITSLRQDKQQNIQFLKENYSISSEMIHSLYQFGNYQYSCGNYGACSEMLYHYRVLSSDADLSLSALWGKLACEILTENYETAYEDLQRLKEAIDSKNFSSSLHQLQQRAWLIHWSLFVFFNHSRGRDGIIDMFFLPQYINTIQICCPWILRYLTAAIITNKRRKNYMKELIKIIQQDSYMYQDPITAFIEALYIKFDFDLVRCMLKDCEDVLVNDIFLTALSEDFLESARSYIIETYCKIHQKIQMSRLSEILNMPHNEGEKWIVNLIRETRMDAKIDFKEGIIIINTNVPSIYQQIIEKTKGIAFRSQVLSTTIDRKENSLTQASK